MFLVNPGERNSDAHLPYWQGGIIDITNILENLID